MTFFKQPEYLLINIRLIIKFANELKDKKTIEIAKEKLYLNFLQFIWEATNQETVLLSSHNLFQLRELKEFQDSRIFTPTFGEKRKSFFISNLGNCPFNSGSKIFMVSDLIIYLIKLKKHSFIR